MNIRLLYSGQEFLHQIVYSGKALRYGAGTEVVTVVITNNTVTPCDLVDSYRRFR
jgi:hypothetical protein